MVLAKAMYDTAIQQLINVVRRFFSRKAGVFMMTSDDPDFDSC